MREKVSRMSFAATRGVPRRSEDHQVSPGEAAAVLLFDGPQQSPGFVEVDVVGPAVEGLEALLTATGAAASVGHPIGAGAVPGHADEERAVVPPVGGPPLLRGLHQFLNVALHNLEVELREFLRVVEPVIQRAGGGGVLAQGGEDFVGITPIGPAYSSHPELSGTGLLKMKSDFM